MGAQTAGRHYVADVAEDGHFLIHLPPASYSLLAQTATQVAVLDVLDLKDNEDREVILRLTPATSITGTVGTPSGSRTWRPAPIRSSSDGARGLVDIQLL
jgi:hypothetical protein